MSKFSSNIRKSAASKLAVTFTLCAALGYALADERSFSGSNAKRYEMILERFLNATKNGVKFVPVPGDEEYIQKAVKLFEDAF